MTTKNSGYVCLCPTADMPGVLNRGHHVSNYHETKETAAMTICGVQEEVNEGDYSGN